MTAPPPPRRRRRWARPIEAVLWLAGVVALGWVAWGYLDAHLYQQRQERLLEEALAAPAPAEQGSAGTDVDPAEDPTGIPTDELAGARRDAVEPANGSPVRDSRVESLMGRTSTAAAASRANRPAAARPGLDALGRLVIARLGLSVMVADGVDNHTLRRAVGHIPGTSRLGSGGNVGLAGHRDGFFRPLKDVRPGDEVVVTTPGAISRYRVEWAEVVSPSDTRSLKPTPYPALTLVTCHPFYYVGTAPDRFVVRARLIESRAATAADAALVTARRGR